MPMIKHVQELQIELTSHCNMKCRFCGDPTMGRVRGFMDKELAKRLILEVAETRFADGITTNVMGEPLLYPHLFEILNFAKQHKVPAKVITNGKLLIGKRAKSLLEACPSEICISYHCGDAKSFEYKVASMSFDQYRKNIRDFIRMKFKFNSPSEITLTQHTSMDDTRHPMPILETPEKLDAFLKEWQDFAHETVKEYHLKWKVPNAIGMGTWKIGLHEILPGVSICFHRVWLWSDKTIQMGTRIVPDKNIFCDQPFRVIGVLWDGRVTYCCIDEEGELAYANVKDGSLIETFNSERMNSIRKKYLYGGVPDKCARCMGKVVDESGEIYRPKMNSKPLAPWDRLKRMGSRIGMYRRRHKLFRTIKEKCIRRLQTINPSYWRNIYPKE